MNISNADNANNNINNSNNNDGNEENTQSQLDTAPPTKRKWSSTPRFAVFLVAAFIASALSVAACTESPSNQNDDNDSACWDARSAYQKFVREQEFYYDHYFNQDYRELFSQHERWQIEKTHRDREKRACGQNLF